jgi:ubiC transcription regulator-associated domain-containing protein
MKNIDAIKNFEILKEQSKQGLLKVLEWAKKGNNFGLDFSDDIQKIQNALKNIEEQKIKVVLVGGFSEGKTTVAAAWLERVMDNMKIDQSESSDAIEIYRPKGLEDKCEIVDTPGLFGFKSKENGLKYEDITKKYISEAHLVLCVLNSVNPLKNSHSEVFKWLFRDLNKLSSTIFVLNKFDDVCDIEDDDDYKELLEIKKESLVNQLDNFIRLTPQEKADLKVVAISANPYGRGLDTWLKDKNYEEISKINTLKEATNKIISGNRTALITGQQQSIITDILTNKVKNIRSIFEQLDKEIRANRDSLTSLEYDLTDTEQEINSNLKRLKTELLNYIKNVKKHISGSDVETFGSIFSEEIGKDGIYLNDSLENIYKKYTNLNNTKIKMLESNLLNELDFREKVSNNVTTTVVKKGLDGIRMIPLGEMRNFVLTSRNTISSFTGITMKFKPWGAIKFAKGIGTAAAGIGVAMELWDVVQKIKNTNKVKKAKEELNNALEDFEKEIDRKFGTENNIAEFSPVFQDLKKMYKGIEIQDKNISNMKVQIEEWYKNSKSIQDINFEEIN